jgi:hypothetical protein
LIPPFPGSYLNIDPAPTKSARSIRQASPRLVWV